jgi:hypothetical protein
MLKKLLLAALLLVSLPAVAEPMFPSLKSCRQAGSDCALVLDANNYLVDADSGDKLSDTPESVGAMNSFELYRDGDRYILENENFSQAKSRRWLVFDYDNGRVALEGAYVFSIDINPSTGPYWHGYDCRTDAKLFARLSDNSFNDAAFQELCGDAEGLVVPGQGSGVTVHQRIDHKCFRLPRSYPYGFRDLSVCWKRGTGYLDVGLSIELRRQHTMAGASCNTACAIE